MGMEDDLAKRMAARAKEGIDDSDKARYMADRSKDFRDVAAEKRAGAIFPGSNSAEDIDNDAEKLEDLAAKQYDRSKVEGPKIREVKVREAMASISEMSDVDLERTREYLQKVIDYRKQKQAA